MITKPDSSRQPAVWQRELAASLISPAALLEALSLPADHPLWRHPRVFVTPHAAAVSDPDALAPAVMRQIAAHERGEPLRGVVDRTAGY